MAKKLKMTKRGMKIAAATAMTVFTLFACFSASVAWFQAIQNQNDDSDSFSITDLAGRFKQMTFHELAANGKTVSTNESACSFKFNKAVSGSISYDWNRKQFSTSGTTTISLNPYETLDRYQPMLLLIELQEEYKNVGANEIAVTATVDHVDGKGFIGERDAQTNEPIYDLSDEDIYETKNGVNYYWLSSVIRFFSKSFSASAFTSFSSGSTYDFTLGNMESQSHFVDINSSTETATFSENINIYGSQANSSVQYIAIIVDYFPDAVEFIYSTYLGDATLESAEYDYELNYSCDWKMEVR